MAQKKCLELKTRPIISYGFWPADHESEDRIIVLSLYSEKSLVKANRIPVKMLEILVNTFRLFWSFIRVNLIQVSSWYRRNFSSEKFFVTFMAIFR